MGVTIISAYSKFPARVRLGGCPLFRNHPPPQKKLSDTLIFIFDSSNLDISHKKRVNIWPIARTFGEVNPENGLTLGLA